MKKYLTFPNITVGLLCVLIIITFALGKLNFDRFNPEQPKKFIEKTLPVIAQNWDSELMYENMPDVKKETIENLCRELKRVFGSCEVTDVAWKTTTLRIENEYYVYSANLNCELGKSVANLIVVPQKDGYKYVSINFSLGGK